MPLSITKIMSNLFAICDMATDGTHPYNKMSGQVISSTSKPIIQADNEACMD